MKEGHLKETTTFKLPLELGAPLLSATCVDLVLNTQCLAVVSQNIDNGVLDVHTNVYVPRNL